MSKVNSSVIVCSRCLCALCKCVRHFAALANVYIEFFCWQRSHLFLVVSAFSSSFHWNNVDIVFAPSFIVIFRCLLSVMDTLRIWLNLKQCSNRFSLLSSLISFPFLFLLCFQFYWHKTASISKHKTNLMNFLRILRTHTHTHTENVISKECQQIESNKKKNPS